MGKSNTPRPLIDLIDGKITHNGAECRVVIGRRKVSIGCTDITTNALIHIAALSKAQHRFGDAVDAVVQDPPHPC